MPPTIRPGPSTQTRDSLELASLASSHSGREPGDSSSSASGIASSRKLSLDGEDSLDGNHGHYGRQTSNPLHDRSISISSVFDFAGNQFPLSASGADGYARIGVPMSRSDPSAALGGSSLEKHKTVTFLNGMSLTVGMIIGSGIFSSPGQVVKAVGSPGASLVVWLICGTMSWTGACSFAELGGAMPLNGGNQVWLAKIFGDIWGFLCAWMQILVGAPVASAMISLIFGEYLVRGIAGDKSRPLIVKGVAILGFYIVIFVNCVSTRMATKMGDLFMFLKLVALAAVTIIGIVVAATGFSSSGPASEEWKSRNWFEGTSLDPSSWAVASYAGLWAFSGWSNALDVAGEFRNSSRDISRVIHTSMTIVIVCYMAANISYFLVLPVSIIGASNTVAMAFGSQVFGKFGGLAFAFVVAGSCFGTLNARAFSDGRRIYAAAKEGWLPPIIARVGIGSSADEPTLYSSLRTRSWFTKRLARLFGDEESGLFFTPIMALMFYAVLTTFFILVGSFGTLLIGLGIAEYSFAFLTMLGVVVLRVREPHLERPYKTWITTPIINCCVSLFILSRGIFAEPMQTLLVALFIATGVPVYYWRMKGNGRKQEPDRRNTNVPWWKFWKL